MNPRRRAARAFGILGAAAVLLIPPTRAHAVPRVIDGFEGTAPWSAVPASGVLMKLTSEPGDRGRCLRVDFDFQGGGGYAVIHRALDLALPANYRFTLRVRGATAPQDFEFKLIDASGENVWWKNRRGFDYPREWTTIATRKRQVEFAWGPRGGGELDHLAAIEFAITAGSGGKGTVWLDELTFEELPPPSATPPRITASGASAPGFGAARAVDGDSTTGWRPATPTSALTMDLGVEREFGGLQIVWKPGRRWQDYDVALASEPGRFAAVRSVRRGGDAHDWLFLPESEARWIRIEARAPAAGAELREVRLLPIECGTSLNRFYEAIARGTRRGRYPRGIRDEPELWTVVGGAGWPDESFFSEDGAADLGAGQPSIEPFLWSENRLWTWADVRTAQSLVGDSVGVPRVDWTGAPVDLAIEATHTIPAFRDIPLPVVDLRYRVLNRSSRRRAGFLYLAVRPFQVNPPSQFLNTPGGVCRLTDTGLEPFPQGNRLDVDGRFVVELHPETHFVGAATFDEGDVTTFLAENRLPASRSVHDALALASAAVGYPFDLGPGDSLVAVLRCHAAPVPRPETRFQFSDSELDAVRAAQDSLQALERDRIRSRNDLGPAYRNGDSRPRRRAVPNTAAATRVSLPPSQRDLQSTIAAQIGWIEINRDGPAIQPGSRAYARSWIRDGALTCSALLRWGHRDEVKAFLEWFAGHQYPDGKVPCCVDARGSDPVPEHDSHGELIYLAAEYFRHTGDRATVEKLWPHVASAVAYLDTLRAQRLGPAWRDTSKREFFGILPPSISHEGYSAKPMHSYWDDFWALRGYQDAAFLARTLGRDADARRIEASLADFRRDFAASIALARKRHGIAYVPGCADLGDFDATSTTIALSPVQGESLTPPGSIDSTFARYWDFFVRRRDGLETWEAFTPYEVRNIGAFVRLGWRDRAQDLIRWFMDHRSPPGWAQFAEVVWNQPKTAKFLGDIPHTWVGSDFVRSLLDCFAYERERDDALVIGAGVREAWVREAPGVAVENVSTWYGPLSMSMRATGRGLAVRIAKGLRVPQGGLVIAAPGVTPRWRATVNGRRAEVGARGELVVREVPATVRLDP